MAQMNNALPALNAKEDKHNIFNYGKERTILYVEWKDEMHLVHTPKKGRPQ